MMIIAAFVSAMLMPAQMMAKENNQRNNRKPVATQVENRKNDYRKDMQVRDRRQKPVKAVQPKPVQRPAVVHKPAPQPVVVHKPAPRPVVVHQPAPRPVVVHQPAPRPVVVHQPAPPVVHHHCNSDAANVAAVAIGVVGLISLLAN